MKDDKQLFGYAAIIMAIGFLVQPYLPAYAFNGPTVSMGSNPIENFYDAQYMSGGTSITIFSNASSSSFIVTQYFSESDRCAIQVDGQSPFSDSYGTYGHKNLSGASTSFTGTLLVPAGSTLSLKNVVTGSLFCKYYVEGYYTH